MLCNVGRVHKMQAPADGFFMDIMLHSSCSDETLALTTSLDRDMPSKGGTMEPTTGPGITPGSAE